MRRLANIFFILMLVQLPQTAFGAIAISPLKCATKPQSFGGYLISAVDAQDLLIQAQILDHNILPPGLLGRGQVTVASQIKKLRNIKNNPKDYEREDVAKADEVYDWMDAQVSNAIDGVGGLFIVDPNGQKVSSKRYLLFFHPHNQIPTGDWIWQQWAEGIEYQVGCGHQEPKGTDFKLQEVGLRTIHLAGHQDDLVLSSYGLKDPFSSSPLYSVKPGSKGTSFTAQGSVGYTFLIRNCGLGESCDPQAFTAFLDAFYAQDSNAPIDQAKSVNRFGAGIGYSAHLDLSRESSESDDIGHWGGLLQLAPELVTDSVFESKAVYGEIKFSLTRAPHVYCLGQNAYTLIYAALQVSCESAVIGDADRKIRDGKQTYLLNNFGRIGGVAGFSLSPDNAICDPEHLLCLFANKLSLTTAYKTLRDVTGAKSTLAGVSPSVQDFDVELAFSLTGTSKGPSLAFAYTNGREDLTGFKLPTWNVSFKGSL